MSAKIEPDVIYSNDDPRLDHWIASPGTRAKWRHLNMGPAFVKRGTRVSYYGRDIIAWHEAQRVETREAV